MAGLGSSDPYFAVLTNPKFRAQVLTPDAKAEFFESGKRAVDYVFNHCRQYCDPSFAPARILDFGCGVGRLCIPFAARAKEVVGLDIAESMLHQARLNCDEYGCHNVVLSKSDDALSAAEGQFDLVHSCLVLQHLDIIRGRRIFEELVSKVAAGGCGVIQVTFGWDKYQDEYGEVPTQAAVPEKTGFLSKTKTSLGKLLRRGPAPQPQTTGDADPEMLMNYYSLSQLMFILERAGIKRVFSDFTNHGGALGAFLFFRKEPN